MKKTFTYLALAACLAISTKGTSQVIYSEDFEGVTFPSLPTGWSQNVTPNDSVGWNSGDNTTLGSTAFNMNSHTNFVGVNDDGHQFAANTDILLKSGTFSLSSASAPYLSFDCCYLHGTYSGATEDATVEVSYDGGSTWSVIATLAANANFWWEPRYINMSAAAGHSSVMLGFRYKDAGGWLYGFAVDNIKVFTPPTNDLGLLSIAPMSGTPQSYGVGGSNITMTGNVFNYGATAVTSYDVHYVFNGGSVVTNTVSASIAPFTAGSFTATTPVTLPTTNGAYPIYMWVSLTGDANSANDSSVLDTLNSVSFMPTKKLAIEEGTGTWCGWCVRGIVYMDSLRTLYGNNVSLVAVHNGDPMTVSAYDSWMGSKISGYPSVVIDRTIVGDPSDLLAEYTAHHNDFGFADITAAATVTTSSVSVAVNVKPALNLNGNYRLVMVLTEDKVHGTAAGWEQHNYYSGSTTNILSGGGVNYNTAPSTIPATSMYYEHVARSITPGATGASSSALPTAMVAGTNYPLTLTAPVTAGWNLNYMHAIVMLLDNTTGRVLNTQNATLTLGVNNVANSVEAISVYPNPTTANANVAFTLQNASKVSIEVSDVTGRILSTVAGAEYAAGDHQVELSTANLSSGLYNVNVISEAGTATTRLTVIK